MKKKLGQDVIKMYEPFRNDKANWLEIEISGKKFQIYDRFEIIEIIGKGAYSVVAAAKDKQPSKPSKQFVAIKKIDKAFEHKIFTKRTLRELRILKLLDHENIISIETLILPKSREQFNDVYVVSELMDTDLTQIIKSNQVLTEDHHKFFMYQLLRGLKYLHSAQIVHRDLKPRNLLVNKNSDLKICDFGLARPIFKNQKSNNMTEYMVSRWYRSPQLLLNANNYTPAVDMWSVGCIFAEMLLRKPLMPGIDTENQIQLMCEFCGPIDVDQIKYIPAESKQYIKDLQKLKKPHVKDLKKVYNLTSPEGADFLKNLLHFNPDKRLTVEQAIKHPFLADLHCEDDEPTRASVDYLDFEFQDYNLTTQQLKDMLYEEILMYHSKQFVEKYESKKLQKQSLIEHILKNSNAQNIDPDADCDD